MREFPRTVTNIPVTLEGSGASYRGTIANLALGGVMVRLSSPKLVPAVSNLRFAPAPQRQPIEVLARVLRLDRDTVSLAFMDLDHHTKSILADNIISSLPRFLEECPYCGGKISPSGKKQQCPKCQGSLDFSKDKVPNLEVEGQEMIGVCNAMRQIFHLIRKVAAADVPVLITGAPGTGKEMVARAIHERSRRGDGPFVAINCGAIPRELLESELFGHEKGAFTGAHRTTRGIVEQAEGGTLFLDEIGELPLELQVKLLRFLQEFSFSRVGGRKTQRADLRIISATNCDLQEMIAAGRFREDLYYRLDVVNIAIPPLKDREDDALIIANVLLKRYASKLSADVRGFGSQATMAIQTYPWPGNIRELVNRIRRGVVMAEGPWITVKDLGLGAVSERSVGLMNGKSLKEAKAEFEARLLTEALKLHQGKAHPACRALKISRSLMYQLIQKYDLKRYTVTPPANTSSEHKPH
jgi:two-component system NtrC family response regulator